MVSVAREAEHGSLGLEGRDPLALMGLVRQGLAYSRLSRFQRASGLGWERVSRLVSIPARTLARRQREGRLRADESERLVRIARIFDLAVALFEGDKAAALSWLQRPQRAFGGMMPLDVAESEIGAREVEALIMRLEHGVFS